LFVGARKRIFDHMLQKKQLLCDSLRNRSRIERSPCETLKRPLCAGCLSPPLPSSSLLPCLVPSVLTLDRSVSPSWVFLFPEFAIAVSELPPRCCWLLSSLLRVRLPTSLLRQSRLRGCAPFRLFDSSPPIQRLPVRIPPPTRIWRHSSWAALAGARLRVARVVARPWPSPAHFVSDVREGSEA
jgi:hypothetical protein